MNLITRHRAPGALLLATATLSALVATPASQAAEVSDTKLTWGGYIKLDVMYSHFSDGPVPQGIGRDTYIPNQIPVSATGDDDAHTYLDFHAKETRLFLRGESIIEGHKVGGYVEMDFIVAQGVGTEAVTNAYNPGLRNAYITYDQFLLGQDWSTFQNMGAIPDVLDFVAFPTDGTVFMRAPMIRYTSGNWVVSLENPETTIATNGGGPTYANTDDNNLLPDLVARYNFKLGTSSLALAGVARQLVDKGQVGNVTDKAVGYGLSFSGKVPLGDSKNDLRFMLNGGDGIGRFLALNTVGDAVIDDDGRLKTLRVTSEQQRRCGQAGRQRHAGRDQRLRQPAVLAVHEDDLRHRAALRRAQHRGRQQGRADAPAVLGQVRVLKAVPGRAAATPRSSPPIVDARNGLIWRPACHCTAALAKPSCITAITITPAISPTCSSISCC